MDAECRQTQGCVRVATYRIAVGQSQGRQVLTSQTLPACDADDPFTATLGNVAGADRSPLTV